ncbi:MAG: Fic family protein [Promethearchaeota archaeon]
MATIIKHKVNGNEYYYLSYSYRSGNKVLKKEKYLGLEIPEFDELTNIWEEFSYEIIKERYLPVIEEIINNYHKITREVPATVVVKNLRTFGIKFTHHSNKIEGSTLSLRDVETVVNNGTMPHDKLVNDVIEAKAHMRIYEKMIETDEDLSMDLICEWHKELFRMTKPDIAGFIRNYTVGIEGSRYEPPMSKIEIEEHLTNLFKWYNEKRELYHPVFLAAIMHYRFLSIHPFGDGNGRMARLLTNYILHKNRCPMFDIDHRIRFQYFKALEKADKREDNELPFILWFFKNYIKANEKYIEVKG